MPSRQEFIASANFAKNRLFPERVFSQSWAFDYLRSAIFYRYYLLLVEKELYFRDIRFITK